MIAPPDNVIAEIYASLPAMNPAGIYAPTGKETLFHVGVFVSAVPVESTNETALNVAAVTTTKAYHPLDVFKGHSVA